MSIIPFNFFLYIYLFYFSNFFFPILSLFMFSFLPTSYSYSLLFPSLIQSPPHICAAYLTSQHRLPRSPNVLPAWAIPDGVVELFPSVLPPPGHPCAAVELHQWRRPPTLWSSQSTVRHRPPSLATAPSSSSWQHRHPPPPPRLHAPGCTALRLVYPRQAAPPTRTARSYNGRRGGEE
jgi:hypothetical protein